MNRADNVTIEQNNIPIEQKKSNKPPIQPGGATQEVFTNMDKVIQDFKEPQSKQENLQVGQNFQNETTNQAPIKQKKSATTINVPQMNRADNVTIEQNNIPIEQNKSNKPPIQPGGQLKKYSLIWIK